MGGVLRLAGAGCRNFAKFRDGKLEFSRPFSLKKNGVGTHLTWRGFGCALFGPVEEVLFGPDL